MGSMGFVVRALGMSLEGLPRGGAVKPTPHDFSLDAPSGIFQSSVLVGVPFLWCDPDAALLPSSKLQPDTGSYPIGLRITTKNHLDHCGWSDIGQIHGFHW